MKITEEIIWNNELDVWHQSLEAQEWYTKNVHSKLSFYVPKEIKQEVANRLGLKGEIPDEQDDSKIRASFIDSYARPQKWQFQLDNFNIEIEMIRKHSSDNWALEKIICKIQNNG